MIIILRLSDRAGTIICSSCTAITININGRINRHSIYASFCNGAISSKCCGRATSKTEKEYHTHVYDKIQPKNA